MRLGTLILLSAAIAGGVEPAASQSKSFEPGTVAVLPFTVAPGTRSAAAWASSMALASALKDILEGQRFTRVLDRSADTTIIEELKRTESVWNVNSVSQVAQDGQLNANYIAYGNILSQTFNAANNCARIEFQIEISDVSTGASVMRENMNVDNDRLPGPPKLCTEASEATALSMARTRAEDKFRDAMAKDFGKRFGYQLVDMRQANEELEVLVRASDGDPKRGTNLVVMVTVVSAFDSTQSYTQELGRMKVDRVEGNVAIARFESPEQAEAFVEHVNQNGPRSVQVKRR